MESAAYGPEQANHFDPAAAGWDLEPRRHRLAAVSVEALLGFLKPDPGQVLLDFGAGTGLVSYALATKVRRVYALDSSGGMLRALAAKQAEGAPRNVIPVLWPESAFWPVFEPLDGVVASMALHHVPDIPALLKTFLAALRPGGRLGVVDLDREEGHFHGPERPAPHAGFERVALSAWARSAGFDRVSLETIHHFTRIGGDGLEREYSLFLLRAEKPG